MSFDSFIQQAWQDHTEHIEAVAERLANAPQLVTQAAQVSPLVRLIVHVFGEHLGRWQDGERLLEALHEHTRGDAAAERALRIGSAALALAQGGGMPALDTEERIETLASAAAVALGRGDTARTSSWLLQALDLAATAPVLPRRALAVAANNVACALGELAERTPEQQRTMLAAAHAARVQWERAGTWLETERAEYVLAKSYLKAGNAAAAQQHAAACLAICERHDASPFERFFAHEALACAARAAGDDAAFARDVQAARSQFDKLDSADQPACRGELDALSSAGAADRPA